MDKPLWVHVYDQLSEMIITGKLRPGEPLREAHLAQQLGTSRVPVREAIHQLTDDGWLERRPRSSARVMVPDHDYINEVFDVRLILEDAAIRRVVRRISLEDVDRLRGISERGIQAAASGDLAGAMQLNAEFHGAITQLAGNRLLVEMIEGLDRRVRWLYGFVEPGRYTEHDDILRALDERHVERAADAVRRHLELTRRDFLERWSAG